MRVGWLADRSSYTGGAELATQLLRDRAPAGVEIVDCAPGRVVPDLDVYALGNVTQYEARELDFFMGSPMVKLVHDLWPHGDPELRERVLDEALVLFISPLQRTAFPYPVRRERMIPTPIELERFRELRETYSRDERDAAVWLGAMTGPHKGLAEAIAWAELHDEVLACYGVGPVRPPANHPNAIDYGELAYEDVPEVLSGYRRFVYLPPAPEPVGRAVLEAWAAGCELITNGNVGAAYWIRSRPRDVERGAEMFWRSLLAHAE